MVNKVEHLKITSAQDQKLIACKANPQIQNRLYAQSRLYMLNPVLTNLYLSSINVYLFLGHAVCFCSTYMMSCMQFKQAMITLQGMADNRHIYGQALHSML